MSAPVERHEPTEHDHAILASPSLNEQLPIQFDTGVVVETFSGGCQGCGRELGSELIYAQIRWPIGKRMAELEGLGYCEPCQLLTRYQARFYNDGRYLVYHSGGWHTYAIEAAPPPNGWQRLLGWLRGTDR